MNFHKYMIGGILEENLHNIINSTKKINQTLNDIQLRNDKLYYKDEEIDEEIKWVIFEYIAGGNHGYLRDEHNKLMDNYNRIYDYIKKDLK